ncbi:hypothetical protein NM208_g453 [Fusarium decemcellulare]|uniref:Uncharacterized protein n=1 Tax=Fusarium decemcellulare TaxID=57161 RepID=A0ACC1SZQ2_9HYPO|nr:hypothetical protein NM208_g453 [Fusarium decemcellulare]
MQYTVAIGLGLASLAAAVPTSIPTLVPTSVSTQVPGASAPADPNNYWQDVIDPWGQYGQVPDTVKRANIEVVGDEGGNSTDYRIGEELDISSDELLEHAKRATVDDYVGLIPGCDKDPSYAKKPGWPPYHGVKIPKDGNDDLCTTGKGDAKCWTEYFLVEAAIEYFSWKKSGSAVNCPAEAGSSCSLAIQSLQQSCSLTGTAETSGYDWKILERSLNIGLDPTGSALKGEIGASTSVSHSWSTTKQNLRQSCAADTEVTTCKWTNPTGQKQNLCHQIWYADRVAHVWGQAQRVCNKCSGGQVQQNTGNGQTCVRGQMEFDFRIPLNKLVHCGGKCDSEEPGVGQPPNGPRRAYQQVKDWNLIPIRPKGPGE